MYVYITGLGSSEHVTFPGTHIIIVSLAMSHMLDGNLMKYPK